MLQYFQGKKTAWQIWAVKDLNKPNKAILPPKLIFL